MEKYAVNDLKEILTDIGTNQRRKRKSEGTM